MSCLVIGFRCEFGRDDDDGDKAALAPLQD